ncbi:hypothetical protein [Thauera sp. SDU_THAU2]|uniref:hypothetical protein n=1 Tax=Thauera sp. SDU_THAU2 TaxID=3136633 RepID=UPI00311F5790
MNALLIPESRDRLIKRWAAVMKFRIGHDDSAILEQLPNGECFPADYPAEHSVLAAAALRKVLGVGILKLIHSRSADLGASVEIRSGGGVLMDLWLLGYEFAGVDYHLAPFGWVLELAGTAPERLSVLSARLDMLDNGALHGMAMLAVQGLPVPDVFEGLLEPAPAADSAFFDDVLPALARDASSDVSAQGVGHATDDDAGFHALDAICIDGNRQRIAVACDKRRHAWRFRGLGYDFWLHFVGDAFEGTASLDGEPGVLVRISCGPSWPIPPDVIADRVLAAMFGPYWALAGGVDD